MKRILTSALAALLVLCATVRPHAQVSINILQGAIPSTTLNAAIATPTQNNIILTSISVGTPNQVVVGNFLYVDQEQMQIMTVPAAATTPVVVRRGVNGTAAQSHANSSTVYAAPGYAFNTYDPPIGSCGTSTTTFLPVQTPWINTRTGAVYQCTSNVWLNITDAFVWVSAANCAVSTSGGTFTAPTFGAGAGNTQFGLVPSAATPPGTPVVQIATTNAGTATNTISCQVPFPTRANLTRGVYVMDATYTYGVQQNALAASTSQAVVAASGTMNGVVVFGQIVFPAAAASETGSTVAQARWDTGTLGVTPCTISSNACSANQLNVATTSAGQFYTVKFTPATPLAMSTDLTAYYVNLTLLAQATTATTIQSAGVLVHYRYLSEGHVPILQ